MAFMQGNNGTASVIWSLQDYRGVGTHLDVLVTIVAVYLELLHVVGLVVDSYGMHNDAD